MSQVEVLESLVKGKVSEWVLSATDCNSDSACFKSKVFRFSSSSNILKCTCALWFLRRDIFGIFANLHFCFSGPIPPSSLAISSR